jgi:hypothetical protein
MKESRHDVRLQTGMVVSFMQGPPVRATIGGYPAGGPDIVPAYVLVVKVNLVAFETRGMRCGSAKVIGFSSGISGHVPWCGEGAAERTRRGPQQRD